VSFYFWLGAEAERMREEQLGRAAMAINRAWYEANGVKLDRML